MPIRTTKEARRIKAQGRADEQRAAAILGTERYPANTGGPCDLIPIDGLYIQVKGGKTVTSAIMRTALASARAAAAKSAVGLPAVVLIDHKDSRIQEWICFPLKEWAAWNGYPKEEKL